MSLEGLKLDSDRVRLGCRLLYFSFFLYEGIE